jgi:hypothetical protein
VFATLIQDPPATDRAAPIVADAYGQLPELASTFGSLDDLFYFTYAVCIFFFVLILAVLLYSGVRTAARRSISRPRRTSRTTRRSKSSGPSSR